jgi:regulatory protein
MNDFEEYRKQKTVYTQTQALEKARRWCALQERCHTETRNKLHSWGQYEDACEEVIAQLISEGFLNEERFARSFARGKFRIKHWGRIKIVNELKQKKISPVCIRKGLDEIDDEEYMQTLRMLYTKRVKEVKERNPWARKAKIYTVLAGKGFEPELIRELMREA